MSSPGLGTFLETTAPFDLDNCADEPIHIPGSIQPRGVLFAVREIDLVVTQVSENVGELLGIEVDCVLDRDLSAVLGSAVGSAVGRAVGLFGSLQERNPLEAILEVGGNRLESDLILHRAGDGIVLVEVEPASGARPLSFTNTYLAVRRTVSDINQAVTLPELYQITARSVRELTGFDRVMVYRYDEEFNGEVVAEEKDESLESFLGLHYPASDIPAQARALYEKSWIRLISDVDYRASPLLPTLDPSGGPLDLSLATLRSVSPIHLQYLRNMGVRASMSISLLRHGSLWGLIACHHYSGPHTPPYNVRTAAEFLGSTLSLRLVDHAEREDLRTSLTSRALLSKLTAATQDRAEPIISGLLGDPDLGDLIACDGVAVTIEGHTATRGIVPDVDTVAAVAAWARSKGEDLVATDSMTAAAPHLSVPTESGSGVLVLPLPGGAHIAWFRTERIHTVDWAGDPNTKVVEGGDGAIPYLTPRASFERWRDVVRLRSSPWTAGEKQLAADLRASTVEALYTRSQEGLRLAEALQRSLLPAALPVVPGWDISAHYETAAGGQVGGDWYDAIALGDDTLAVVLGDVAGHGVAAAGTMAQLRNALRAYLVENPSPGWALGWLHAFAARLLPNAFATALVVSINTCTGQATASSAGHLSPYIVGPEHRVVMAPMDTSPPLGAPDATPRVSEFALGEGEALVLYSDGLIERRGEHLDISLQRLEGALAALGPHDNADAVFAAITDDVAEDDATVVIVRHTSVAAAP